MALHHVALTTEIQGDTRKAALEFRKHLGWYTRGLPGATGLRRELQQIESLDLPFMTVQDRVEGVMGWFNRASRAKQEAFWEEA